MNDNDPFVSDLQRLGRAMAPVEGFIDRVMSRIEASGPVCGADFQSALQKQAGSLHHNIKLGRHPMERPRSMLLRWIVPLATAAAVLLVVGYVRFWRLSQAPPQAAGDGLRLVGTTSEWQTSARRVLLEGEVPAREISRQRFERLEWDDAQSHAKFQRMVPKEKITFISADSY